MNITQCRNINCTKRSQCLRYRSVVEYPKEQACAYFTQDKNGNCDFKLDLQGWPSSVIVSLEDADNRHKG